MPIIATNTNIDIQITPKMLAEAFWDMDDEQQSKFFNELGDIVTGNSFAMMTQMEATRNGLHLTERGRLMQKIIGGDY